MNRTIELTIHNLEDRGEGTAAADVRIGRGPVHVGDIFLFAYGPSKTYRKEKWVDINPIPAHEVNLRVRKIEAYGRKFEELNEGMTARVILVGEGFEHVSPYALVGNKRPDV